MDRVDHCPGIGDQSTGRALLAPCPALDKMANAMLQRNGECGDRELAANFEFAWVVLQLQMVFALVSRYLQCQAGNRTKLEFRRVVCLAT